MVHKYTDKDAAIETAKAWAEDIANDESKKNEDVQVVLSNGEFYVESPPEIFVRSWEKVILYLEVSHCSVREKSYE